MLKSDPSLRGLWGISLVERSPNLRSAFLVHQLVKLRSGGISINRNLR